jgi:biopolymer transport protein ExbD
MMNRAVVVLGIAAALGAAWLTKDWPNPERTRLRGHLRTPRADVPDAPDAAPVPGTADPAAAAKEPGKAAGEAAKKPEPAKPEPPKVEVRVRTIEDLALPTSAQGKPLTLPRINEIHVDLEGQITWHAAGEAKAMKTYKMLGDGLRQRTSDPTVFAVDAQTPWQTVRHLLLLGQDNFTTDVHLGVATEKEPKTLRTLAIRQTPRSDDPLPEGDVFTVAVRAEASGAPEVTVQGTKIASFPADLALAWNDWRKAHPDAADTKDPEKTRVVLEAHRAAPLGTVVRVLDVLRGIGVESERLSGQIAPRPK